MRLVFHRRPIRRYSEGHASGGHGPEAFHLPIADADIPVIYVARWITVTWDELQLVVELQHAVGIRNHSMLVGALDVFDIVTPIDHRETRVDALRLPFRIANRLVGLGVRHDRGPDEQCILEIADELAALVLDPLIVGIHEYVGA